MESYIDQRDSYPCITAAVGPTHRLHETGAQWVEAVRAWDQFTAMEVAVVSVWPLTTTTTRRFTYVSRWWKLVRTREGSLSFDASNDGGSGGGVSLLGMDHGGHHAVFG